MESRWLKESLFAGMSGNAFKLGTVLSLGWFWTKVSGCLVLYRGNRIEEVDFNNILSVAEPDANQINSPSYCEHADSSTYFYVVNRVNRCGFREYTLAAVAEVAIDKNGDLVQFGPNSIFNLNARQVEGNNVQLLWYYCPVGQDSEPVYFKIYYDGGTGQIDYVNPLASVKYIGRKFYIYQSDALNAGKYLFAVRAEDLNATQSNSLARIKIEVVTTPTEVMNNIIQAEVI